MPKVITNNILDKNYLLDVPIAFVLQNKTMQEIENVYDENSGWNVLHYAIAEANIEKVRELVHFSFNLSLLSRKNFISQEIYKINEKKKIEKISFPNKIQFSDEGFTPVHLAMFLYSYYSKLSEDFFYKTIVEKYQTILSILINENQQFRKCFDGSKNSILDTAFLLENINLIDIVQMQDGDFSSLNTVSSITALEITKVMTIKNKDGSHQHISDSLNKKILNDSLTTELNKKPYHGKIIKNNVKKI